MDGVVETETEIEKVEPGNNKETELEIKKVTEVGIQIEKETKVENEES